MEAILEEVLAAFALSNISRAEKYGNGRTHATYIVEASEGKFILQKMNPVIAPTAVDDMRSATEFLSERGIRTCRVIPTKNGTSTFEREGAHWRVLTYIDGHAISGNLSPSEAESAGEAVGVFHSAFQEYKKSFSYRIPTVQTPRYAFNMLLAAKDDCKDPAKTECNPIANEILSYSQNLELDFSEHPLRPLHGDPKLDNILFDGDKAIALVDLDNLNMYRLPLELGDMLRSFCSRSASGTFDAEIWSAALRGYRSKANFFTELEWKAIPDGFAAITLALAARLLTDAYEEKYFAHDPAYPTLYAQNLSKAQSYLDLFKTFAAKREGGEIRM